MPDHDACALYAQQHATEQGKTAVANGSKRVAGEPEGGGMDKKMRKAMDANLRELELMHKRVRERGVFDQGLLLNHSNAVSEVLEVKAKEGAGGRVERRGSDFWLGGLTRLLPQSSYALSKNPDSLELSSGWYFGLISLLVRSINLLTFSARTPTTRLSSHRLGLY